MFLFAEIHLPREQSALFFGQFRLTLVLSALTFFRFGNAASKRRHGMLFFLGQRDFFFLTFELLDKRFRLADRFAALIHLFFELPFFRIQTANGLFVRFPNTFQRCRLHL